MGSEVEVPGTDYWDHGFGLGTSSTWRFDGADGLARLSGPAVFTAEDPPSFRARLTRVQLDHVALEAFESTAHTVARTRVEIEDLPASLLSFTLVVDGRATIGLDSGSFEVVPGSCVIVDSRDPYRFTAPGRTRLLRTVVGLEHVPSVLHARGATLPGPLDRTTLVESYIAFVSSVLSTTAAGRQARGDQLIRVVADLQSAVLAEAQQRQVPRMSSDRLRHRMEEYIEANYADVDLDPAAVSTAFGISLRQAHAVFNDDERTLARFIRDRRVAAAARELRVGAAPVRFAHLARLHGFRNGDTLARAFQQRFGMSMAEYRDSGHRRLD